MCDCLCVTVLFLDYAVIFCGEDIFAIVKVHCRNFVHIHCHCHLLSGSPNGRPLCLPPVWFGAIPEGIKNATLETDTNSSRERGPKIDFVDVNLN